MRGSIVTRVHVARSFVVVLLLASPALAQPPAAPSPAAPHVITRVRKCMGTECDFKAFASDEDLVDKAFARGFDEFDRLEALTTSWRDNSEVARINQNAGKKPVPVSADTLAIIEKSLWVSKLTDGAFDI